MSRLRLAAVEESRALRHVGPLEGRPRYVSTIGESGASLLGPITREVQCAGARRAGHLHAACEEAGAGNVATGALCTHRAIARARLETLSLQRARQCSTLPGCPGAPVQERASTPERGSLSLGHGPCGPLPFPLPTLERHFSLALTAGFVVLTSGAKRRAAKEHGRHNHATEAP
jgi:hypothetical protein